MHLARPAIAVDPRSFGRGPARTDRAVAKMPTASDDMRLFAMTFTGGFLFVSLLIA